MSEIEGNRHNRFISPTLFYVSLALALIPIILCWIGSPGYSMQRYDAMGNVVDLTPANPMNLYASIIMILSFAFWLLCVYELHKDVRNTTNGGHSIPPNKAAFLHLIPFWNCYWVFKWTKEIACTFNKTSSLKMSKWLYGTLLLLSMIWWTIQTLVFLMLTVSSSTNGFKPAKELDSFIIVSSIILVFFSIVGATISAKAKRRHKLTLQPELVAGS